MDEIDYETIYLAVLLETPVEPADCASDEHFDWQMCVRDLLCGYGLPKEVSTIRDYYIWMLKQREGALSSQAGYKACNREDCECTPTE